jgi:hypothetical protein
VAQPQFKAVGAEYLGSGTSSSHPLASPTAADGDILIAALSWGGAGLLTARRAHRRGRVGLLSFPPYLSTNFRESLTHELRRTRHGEVRRIYLSRTHSGE